MTITPPAALLPTDEELDQLVVDVVNSVANEVAASQPRDAERLTRAVNASIERVTGHLDREEPYEDRASLPARVYDVLVGLGAAYLKRPGAAYGTAGYDDADPLGRRAEAALLAGLTPGERERWGVA